MRIYLLMSLFILLYSCTNDSSKNGKPVVATTLNALLVDKNADAPTVQLYERLTGLQTKGTMVGHHETNAYGVGWKYDGTTETSDVKQVTGEMPAVVGWDVSGIDMGNAQVIDSVDVSEVTKHVEGIHAQGGINSFCWHAYNPIDGNDSWQVNNTTVKNILPGGPNYAEFKTNIVRIADYLKSLKDKDGNCIPILFRPWHEHTGNWFWWGTSGCTPDEFKTLWQTTVKLLRDTLEVNNLIYVYSSGAVSSEAEYLERYPGDDYVDVLGFDEYYHNELQYIGNMKTNVAIIKKLGELKGKPYAITETGNEGIKQADWFTNQLYPIIQNQGLSYILFWRNANSTHHYVPYVGHAAATDFKAFVNKPDMLMLSKIQERE